MAVFTGISLSGDSTEDIVDAITALNRSLEYQMANLDSENVREIGGWRVAQTELSSKSLNVGMSTSTSGENPVRFWAGGTKDNAPFRVYNDGSITITKGSITWGPVGAPLYSDIGGTKPPANADNTDTIITMNGSNFRKVAGAYVYDGPANYSQINGGPPANADNTANSLPASLGINFTQIGQNYIYTGELSANKITSGTLSANYINGGTISGITIQTGSPGGQRVVLSSSSHLVTAYGNDTQYVQMNAFYYGESQPTLSWVNGANRADMFHTGSNGVMLKSTNHIRISPGGYYGTTYFTGIVDFAGAGVQGLNTTAKFG